MKSAPRVSLTSLKPEISSRLLVARLAASAARAVDPLSLRVTTTILCAGLLAMAAWEHTLVGSSIASRIGPLVLVLAAVGLITESKAWRLLLVWWSRGDLTQLWQSRWNRINKVTVAAAASGGLLLALVWISGKTTGCTCRGGAQGLTEVAAWAALVYVVIVLAPRATVPLMASAVVGCAVAAVLAFLDLGSPSGLSVSERLAGSYGNANYFAATQAIALPVAVLVLLRSRRIALRLTALGLGAVLGAALLLSYSRSGILAGALGVFAVIVLSIPQRYRLPAAGAILLTGLAAGFVLYPAFNRSRTTADFSYALSIAHTTDKSGWQSSETGLIPNGPSHLKNAGPGTISVSTLVPGSGASQRLADASPAKTYHLRFQARSLSRHQTLFFGMEDNLIAAGPARATTRLGESWTRLSLAWRPSRSAPNARVYFWSADRGTFQLRKMGYWTESRKDLVRISTHLLGVDVNIRAGLNKQESHFIASREGAARVALDAFESHPLFGIGWERFPSYSAPRSGVGRIASHDDYLRFAAELGLPGILLLLCVCICIVWAAFQARSSLWGPALFGLILAAGFDVAFSNILSVPDVILPAATAAAIALGSMPLRAEEVGS